MQNNNNVLSKMIKDFHYFSKIYKKSFIKFPINTLTDEEKDDILLYFCHNYKNYLFNYSVDQTAIFYSKKEG